MAMTATDNVVASPSETEIRAALDRVVASLYFRGSPRLASFLCFVVEATLAGNADRIKGYSIAIGALGRNDTFDPQTNPIVRVEAGRLRRALERYYDGSGRHDEIVIALPCGSYVPTFGHRGIARRPQTLAAHGRRLIPRAVRRRFRLVVLVTGIAACVSVTFDLALILAQRAIAPGTCALPTTGDATNAGAPNSSNTALEQNRTDPRAQSGESLPRT
jgi:hypothetical protein